MSVCGGTRITPADLAGDLRVPLNQVYDDLRIDCCDLEELLAAAGDRATSLTEKDIKRLDKAVTVMKVAFKIVKKVVKKRRVSADIIQLATKQATAP